MLFPTILITQPQEYLIFGVIFFCAVFVSWTVPGSFLNKFFKLEPFPNLVAATLIGMVMWAWQGMIVGLLHIRFITPLYIIAFSLLWIFHKRYKYLPGANALFSLKKHRFYLSIGLGGIILLMTPLIINGVSTQNGVLFCCTSDTFWYLGLTQELVKRYPPEMPGLSGVTLSNYHYFYNLTIAELVRIFHLPLAPTIYLYSRILYAVLYAATGFMLVRKLTSNTLAQKIFFFLLFFGSDFAHITGLLLSGKLELNYTSIFLSQMTLFNMPMAVATILLFFTLYLLLQTHTKNSWSTYVIIGALAGSVLGYKTHMGIILIMGVAIFALVESIQYRSLKSLLLIASSGFFGSLIFLPTNAGSGGLYPSWFFQIEQVMKNPHFAFDPQELEKISYWTKKRRLFTLPPIQILRILLYEFYFACIYIISFFGTTLFGLFIVKGKAIPKAFHLMIIGMIVAGTLLGMFFLQTTGVGHTYNFLIVAYILAQIYAALALGRWATNKRLLYITLGVVGCIITINFIRTYQSVLTYTTEVVTNKMFVLTHAEMEALFFLQNLPDTQGYVLVDPANFLNYVTPYTKVFMKHPLYFSGEYIISALNLPYQKRFQITNTIKDSDDPHLVSELMQAENIRYIYAKKPDGWSEYRGGMRVFIPVFSNAEVDIYTINRNLKR